MRLCPYPTRRFCGIRESWTLSLSRSGPSPPRTTVRPRHWTNRRCGWFSFIDPERFRMSGALFGYFLLVAWLFASGRKPGRGFSAALWVPLVWILIVGTKSPSAWLDSLNGATGDTEGSSLLDTFIFLALIAAGCCVLARRRVDWKRLFATNKWLFIYFSYAGISLLWSDHAFPSFKVWTKDAGNIVMVLVVL